MTGPGAYILYGVAGRSRDELFLPLLRTRKAVLMLSSWQAKGSGLAAFCIHNRAIPF